MEAGGVAASKRGDGGILEAGGVAGVRKLVDGSTEASGDVSDSGEASVDVDSGEASGAEVDDSGVDKWIPPPHNGGAVGVYDQMPDRAGGYCLYIFYSNSTASVPTRPQTVWSFSDCITSTMQAHSPAFIPFSVLQNVEAYNDNVYLQCGSPTLITLLARAQRGCSETEKYLPYCRS